IISTMSRELNAGVRGPPLYLELGLMTGALWLITTRGPLRFLPNHFSNFDAKFLCSAIESAGVKDVSWISRCRRQRSFSLPPAQHPETTSGDLPTPCTVSDSPPPSWESSSRI